MQKEIYEEKNIFFHEKNYRIHLEKFSLIKYLNALGNIDAIKD